MKNYYDELEVSKTASKEVIEKVYKVLAKKYHPDTTKQVDKQAAEEKFKAISEAYEILSDDEKRKKYDSELNYSNPTISYEEYMNVVTQRDILNDKLNKLKNQYYQKDNITKYYRNLSNTDNNYQNTNSNYTYSTTHDTTNSQNKTHYSNETNRYTSIFVYYQNKIKELISNILLLLLSVIVSIFIVNFFYTIFTNF